MEITELGIETGLAIFEELQLLERNDEGIKLLPPAGKKLDASEIYRRGEQLKSGAADFRVFQFEPSVEQIWEAILEKLSVDDEQILEASNVYEVRAFQDAIEDSRAQSEQSAEAIENDNTTDGGAAEANHPPKPPRANAKVTVEQVKEIRARREAGESYSKLAKEFGLTPTGVRNIAMRNTWKDVE